MVKLLDPVWTEWASLSLNKQKRKEDLPPLLALCVFVDHTMGFSIPAVNLPLLWSGKKDKFRSRSRSWGVSAESTPCSRQRPRGFCTPTVTHRKMHPNFIRLPIAGHGLVLTCGCSPRALGDTSEFPASNAISSDRHSWSRKPSRNAFYTQQRSRSMALISLILKVPLCP